MAPHRDILLAGQPRSGSTWLGRTLAQAPGVLYAEEPDQVDVARERPGANGFLPSVVLRPGERSARHEALWRVAFAGAVPAHLPKDEGYPGMPRVPRVRTALGKALLRVPIGIRDPLLGPLSRVMSRRPAGRRTIVKSVMVSFSVEWLAERFDPEVVLIQRDPRSIVASRLEFHWVRAFGMAQRADITEGIVKPLGLPTLPTGADDAQRCAWFVGVMSAALAAAHRRNPQWVLLTHEELAVEPIARFRELYQRLDLTWSATTEAFLRDSDRAGSGFATQRVGREQPDRWKRRLSPSQVSEIEAVLGDFPTRGWIQEP